MNLLEAIKQSVRGDWEDAAYWLLCTVIGNMPIWVLLIPVIRLSQTVNVNMFESGEFALYSWSVLFGAFYMVNREINPFRSGKRERLIAKFTVPFPNRRFLLHIVLLLALVCFAVLVTTSLQDLTQEFTILDKRLVSWVTGIIFLISLALSFVITGVENAFIEHKFEFRDVEAIQRELEEYKAEQAKTLEKEFDKLS